MHLIAYIISGFIVLIAAAVAVAGHALTRTDTGRHGENANTYSCRTRPLTGDIRNADQTEEMAALDRDMVMAYDHARFVASEAVWADDMQDMWAEHAHIEADLRSGRLAFPEWIWTSKSPYQTTTRPAFWLELDGNW